MSVARKTKKRAAGKRARGKKPAAPRDAVVAAAERQIPITDRDRAAGRWFEKLVALQAKLRGPGGCPWDREQTHESLRKFLIEETYETLEAIESGDGKKFASEMGDLLLQVVFHSILAEEAGAFTASDVIESVYTKMIRRHPHVFGDAKANTSAAVLKNWEQIKAEERAGEAQGAAKGAGGDAAAKAESVLAGVPKSLPGVLEAYQLTRRASHIGFDWENLDGVLEKMNEESRELLAETKNRPNGKGMARLEEEVGDLLFAAVNVARFVGVDPEIALKKANSKFKERFTWMEGAVRRTGKRLADVPRARMEELWNEAKAAR